MSDSKAQAEPAPPSPSAQELPKRWRWLCAAFGSIVRRDLRKSFNAVRVLRSHKAPSVNAEHALVVYINHPSWWDPMICFHLARSTFRDRAAFGPIDAKALAQYPMFKHLGFYGVDRGTIEGTRSFLRISEGLCRQSSTSLWITPQGSFQDVRVRPLKLESGLAHLAARLAKKGIPTTILPVAVEYVFWEERRPELLLAYGNALNTSETAKLNSSAPQDWQQHLERGLEQAQDTLQAAAMAKDIGQFRSLIEGKAGINPAYNALRRLAARMRGRKYQARHREGAEPSTANKGKDS